MNAGLYEAVRSASRRLPVDARAPSAVVVGNVETSQRIADTVLLALARRRRGGAGAGDDEQRRHRDVGWTYYETLGGGQGARPRRRAVRRPRRHVEHAEHAVEALELDLPLRVERYELLDGSGGDGRHRGGDGLVRSLRVLEPATLSLLTDRRRHAPHGLPAASPGGRDGTS